MPHLIVKLWTGKSETQKQQLAEALVKAARSVIGYGEESYSVVIEDIEPKNWEEQVYRPDIMGQKEKLFKKPGYQM